MIATVADMLTKNGPANLRAALACATLLGCAPNQVDRQTSTTRRPDAPWSGESQVEGSPVEVSAQVAGGSAKEGDDPIMNIGEELIRVRAQAIDEPTGIVARSADIQRVLVDVLNTERDEGIDCGGRRARGETLSPSPELMAAAQDHARDMATRGFFSHRSPEGHRAAWRASGRGYDGAVVENLAWGPQDPQGALDTWRNSRDHCATLVDARWTDVGTGHAVGAGGRTYWVLLLGKGFGR